MSNPFESWNNDPTSKDENVKATHTSADTLSMPNRYDESDTVTINRDTEHMSTNPSEPLSTNQATESQNYVDSDSNSESDPHFTNNYPQDATEEEEAEATVVTGTSKFLLTVEIPLFLMIFATSITGPVISNMILDRTCRYTFGYNDTICSQLEQPGIKDPDVQKIENDAQSVTTLVLMVKAVIEGVLPAALSLFLGVWSNKHGRKPLIDWPLFGFSLTSILITAYSLMGEMGPWWFLVTSVPFSFSGGTCSLYNGAFCYINDVIPPDKRSFRLSMMGLAIFVGVMFGTFLSPYALDGLGTPGLLLLAASFAVFAYVYSNLWIKESVTDAVPGSLRSIFDISLVKEILETCTKQRPNFERTLMILLVTCSTINLFVEYGAGNIAYLYARQKLSWNIREYSTYSTLTTLAIGIPLVVIVRKITKDDIITTMIGFGGCAVETVFKCIATATTSWLMYLSNSTPILRGLCSALIRAVISNRLESEEAIKVYTMMSVLEAIAPIFSSVIYNSLYKATLSVMPEAAYVMTIGIYTGLFCMMCVVQYLTKKYPAHPYSVVQS